MSTTTALLRWQTVVAENLQLENLDSYFLSDYCTISTSSHNDFHLFFINICLPIHKSLFLFGKLLIYSSSYSRANILINEKKDILVYVCMHVCNVFTTVPCQYTSPVPVIF